jgi:indolepyruvate ferredoxin oxidoreductase alpha subunit
MGGGFTMAHGMQKAGEPRKVVGVVGDSTFFHSGITGALNVAYNKGLAMLIVLDNRITAMTGHQDNPGTGMTLMGEPTIEANIEEIARACGFKKVMVCDPYNQEETTKIVKECLNAGEPSFLVVRGACVLHEPIPNGKPLRIDDDICIECGKCIELGCPAIEAIDGKPFINEFLCGGCNLCTQVCIVEAISPREVFK